MSHIYCPECGFQNPEAANYCSKCGALLVKDEPVVHIYAEGRTEKSSLELEAELQALVEEIIQGDQAETEAGASR